MAEKIICESFSKASCGREAFLYTLSNKHGMVLKTTDFGAAIVSILIPEKNGGVKDVVLGFDSVSGYEKTGLYLGATIGRYAGQVRDAQFTLNGKTYSLYANDHTNTLHGGQKGFDKRFFTADICEAKNKITFSYFSPSGEEGFPGNLQAAASYQLTDQNEIIMSHTAKSDCDTILSMTNHAYYNLNGHASGSIENHRLTIPATEFLELAPDCCPNGRILPVHNTPMDFTSPHTIGTRIAADDEQLRISEGYDHNWNIAPTGSKYPLCAELENDSGSIRMQMFSGLPGLQMYSGNYLNGSEAGKDGYRYGHRGALCLEPQFYPASPSYPQFPSPILKQNEIYKHKIIVKFFYSQ